MTRIVAGRAGGVRLQVPPGERTRPTSERVREALFSRLEHEDALDGARALDLYAGSGALGLEAASRGAAAVLLVEVSRRVADVARRNARQVLDAWGAAGPAGPRAGDGDAGAAPQVLVRAGSVRAVLGGQGTPYDLIFLDPPYELAQDALAGDLTALAGHGWLAPGATLVIERSGRSPEPRLPDGVAATGDRRYGDTRLWFARAT